MLLKNKNMTFKLRRSKVTDYAALKIYCTKKGFKSYKNSCLYMIFDWLSVSFSYAVNLWVSLCSANRPKQGTTFGWRDAIWL